MRKISPLMLISALMLLVVLGTAAHHAFKASSLETDTQLLDAKVADLTAKTKDLESKGVASAASASELIAQIDKEYVVWSKIIQRVQNVVPKNSKNKPKVDFLSYSGGRDGKITLNTRTLNTSDDPYQDTADVLRAFNGSDDFYEAFLPGINKTVLEDGSEVLNYVLQMSFKKDVSTNNSTNQ